MCVAYLTDKCIYLVSHLSSRSRDARDHLDCEWESLKVVLDCQSTSFQLQTSLLYELLPSIVRSFVRRSTDSPFSFASTHSAAEVERITTRIAWISNLQTYVKPIALLVHSPSPVIVANEVMKKSSQETHIHTHKSRMWGKICTTSDYAISINRIFSDIVNSSDWLLILLYCFSCRTIHNQCRAQLISIRMCRPSTLCHTYMRALWKFNCSFIDSPHAIDHVKDIFQFFIIYNFDTIKPFAFWLNLSWDGD